MIPIEVHTLTKQFGKLTAVDNLNLRIAQGEFFGFIGPNGAGKTTTLQMLSGQLPPTSGTATVLGIDAAADPIAVKAAGHIFYLSPMSWLFVFLSCASRHASHKLAGQEV